MKASDADQPSGPMVVHSSEGVVPFNGSVTTPKARARHAFHVYHAAMRAAQEEVRAAGVPVHGDSAFSQMFHTGNRMADVWERHAARLERALHTVLAMDALVSEEQRARILSALHGQGGRMRDANVLLPAEGELVQHYRNADAGGKQMLRTMARLAANKAADDREGA